MRSTSSAFDLKSPYACIPLLTANVHACLDDSFVDNFNLFRDVTFRTQVQSSELAELRKLHTEWFPVAYNEEFYTAVERGDNVLTVLVDCVGGGVVGAATVAIRRRERQYNPGEELVREICGMDPETTNIAYILTLGVVDELRGKGLGRQILEKILSEIPKIDPECQLVMLHVIEYNRKALRLYTQMNFTEYKKEPNFYFLGEESYDGILFYKRIGPPNRGFFHWWNNKTLCM